MLTEAGVSRPDETRERGDATGSVTCPGRIPAESEAP